MSELIEHSVNRKVCGRLSRGRVIAISLYIILPIIAILFFFTRQNSVILAFGSAVVIIADVIIAAVTYPYFFKIEYDYSLFDDNLRISTVHNKKIASKTAEINLRQCTRFFDADKTELNGDFRKVYSCYEDENGIVYGLVISDGEDRETNDLLLFTPNEKMIRAISSYVRLSK